MGAALNGFTGSPPKSSFGDQQGLLLGPTVPSNLPPKAGRLSFPRGVLVPLTLTCGASVSSGLRPKGQQHSGLAHLSRLPPYPHRNGQHGWAG